MEDIIKIRQRSNVFGQVIELMGDCYNVDIPIPAHAVEEGDVLIIPAITTELVQNNQGPRSPVRSGPGSLTKGPDVLRPGISPYKNPVGRQGPKIALIIEDKDSSGLRLSNRPPRQGRFPRPPPPDDRL